MTARREENPFHTYIAVVPDRTNLYHIKFTDSEDNEEEVLFNFFYYSNRDIRHHLMNYIIHSRVDINRITIIKFVVSRSLFVSTLPTLGIQYLNDLDGFYTVDTYGEPNLFLTPQGMRNVHIRQYISPHYYLEAPVVGATEDDEIVLE